MLDDASSERDRTEHHRERKAGFMNPGRAQSRASAGQQSQPNAGGHAMDQA